MNDGERLLFRRLSVLCGPFELAAAEAVGAAADLPAESVLGHLSGLVDESLVVRAPGPGGQTRWRMLETVRQYAAEQLADGGEGDEARSQFVGRYGDEATLFRLAAQLEQARPWAGRRPPVSA